MVAHCGACERATHSVAWQHVARTQSASVTHWAGSAAAPPDVGAFEATAGAGEPSLPEAACVLVVSDPVARGAVQPATARTIESAASVPPEARGAVFMMASGHTTGPARVETPRGRSPGASPAGWSATVRA